MFKSYNHKNNSDNFKNKQYPCKNILTVLLHDYFHRGVFKEYIGEKQWNRFESRLEKNLSDVCKLLNNYNYKATFFTVGWIADKYPDLIRNLVKEGHEIASAGYYTRGISEMTPAQFREDVRRAKIALENACSNKILGFRCAYGIFKYSDLWALKILSEEGYLYDASYRPPFIDFRRKTGKRFVHKYLFGDKIFWEFPISCESTLCFNITIAGGNYLRQFPYKLMLHYYRKWCDRYKEPFILYFHPWELDSQQPVISAISIISKIRQYRNLGKLKWLLPIYFKENDFVSISQFLAVTNHLLFSDQSKTKSKEVGEEKPFNVITVNKKNIKDVTVIIPCYNEEFSIPYLIKALDEVVECSECKYRFNFLFIDDGSTDNTNMKLQKLLRYRPNYKLIKHEGNKGITAAIKTGIKAADTEIICSIDADCSYDPLELLNMIPLLDNNVDIVTASPYHPKGFVLNVPKWRLLLSRSLSRIYRLFLTHKLNTYTSCFRVYRRSIVVKIENDYDDYRGLVEMITKLDLMGGIIKEYPTTLHCRIFGQSNMKILKTIVEHIKLILKVLKLKYLDKFIINGVIK